MPYNLHMTYTYLLGTVKWREINSVSHQFYFYFELYFENNLISQRSKLRLTHDVNVNGVNLYSLI